MSKPTEETAIKSFPGGRGKTPTFTDVNLDTLEDSRKTFARIIKGYGTGEISESMSRTLSYMLSAFLNYWKVELDCKIEERLAALEKAIADSKRGRK